VVRGDRSLRSSGYELGREAIEEFESKHWQSIEMRVHAEKFDSRVFAFRVLQFLGAVAPSSCASDLIAGARLLAKDTATRTWPRLAVAR
jgi:hypothetical protein